MLLSALSTGVSMYIINDGIDDYWRGEINYFLDLCSKIKDLSQNVQKIRIVDSTREEMNLPFAQRRQLAVEHVLEDPVVKYIYWTEPEKSDLLLE
jgi:hypothetical protein